mmetsp:Transcript_162/g.306  ORF Transcript_162/g.306 Transcript_162/m.306 type:complete len:260 (+) Transcript_162:2233-3012(+)
MLGTCNGQATLAKIFTGQLPLQRNHSNCFLHRSLELLENCLDWEWKVPEPWMHVLAKGCCSAKESHKHGGSALVSLTFLTATVDGDLCITIPFEVSLNECASSNRQLSPQNLNTLEAYGIHTFKQDLLDIHLRLKAPPVCLEHRGRPLDLLDICPGNHATAVRLDTDCSCKALLVQGPVHDAANQGLDSRSFQVPVSHESPAIDHATDPPLDDQCSILSTLLDPPIECATPTGLEACGVDVQLSSPPSGEEATAETLDL